MPFPLSTIPVLLPAMADELPNPSSLPLRPRVSHTSRACASSQRQGLTPSLCPPHNPGLCQLPAAGINPVPVPPHNPDLCQLPAAGINSVPVSPHNPDLCQLPVEEINSVPAPSSQAPGVSEILWNRRLQKIRHHPVGHIQPPPCQTQIFFSISVPPGQ